MTISALGDLASRLPANADAVPRLAALKAQIGRTQVLANQLFERQAALASDMTLSPGGRRDGMREFIGKTAAADIARLGAVVRISASKLDAWAQRVRTPTPRDKGDASGAVKAVELRALLRGMSSAERI